MSWSILWELWLCCEVTRAKPRNDGNDCLYLKVILIVKVKIRMCTWKNPRYLTSAVWGSSGQQCHVGVCLPQECSAVRRYKNGSVRLKEGDTFLVQWKKMVGCKILVCNSFYEVGQALCLYRLLSSKCTVYRQNKCV